MSSWSNKKATKKNKTNDTYAHNVKTYHRASKHERTYSNKWNWSNISQSTNL